MTSSMFYAGPPLPLVSMFSQGSILDIACGNGLTSRRLAALGAQVKAFDFSANLIDKPKPRQIITKSRLC